MRDIKSKCELELDQIFYPWQVIQGEGETWLILRQKKKLDTREIKEVRNIFLDSFTWSVPYKQAGKSLYRGNIGFTVYYMEKNEDETDVINEEAAGEESSCRQLLNTGKTVNLVNVKGRESYPSVFSSILLNEIKPCEGPSFLSNGSGAWKTEIPWQAWLYGEGEDQEPKVVKVHLGQVGLRTVLLEVIIKLHVKPDLRLAKFEKSKCMLLPKEEILYTIREGEIQEVIGASVNRAFYSSSVDLLTDCLSLRNLKKTTVIFITAGNGGEKILTASALSNEQTKMTGFPVPLFSPAVYRCLNRVLDILKVDSNKVLCKNEYLWSLDYEIEDTEEQHEEKSSLPNIDGSGTAQVQTLIPLRKRPGEKWLKSNDKQSKTQAKTGMLLKIVK